jgi:hypothetical protein
MKEKSAFVLAKLNTFEDKCTVSPKRRNPSTIDTASYPMKKKRSSEPPRHTEYIVHIIFMWIRAPDELNESRIWRVLCNVNNQHLKKAVGKNKTCGT